MWLGIISAVFAFIAAILWFWSALIEIPSQFDVVSSHFVDDIAPAGAVHSVGSSQQLNEFAEAVRKQSRLSACAATSAGISALFQVATIMFH
jgi:hypothetical protein